MVGIVQVSRILIYRQSQKGIEAKKDEVAKEAVHA